MDVGIEVPEEKHGYNNGKTQERYGLPVAEELLDSIGFSCDRIEIVKNITANHHYPSRCDYPEPDALQERTRS